MIYLLRKHDIISVPIIREAYIICEADIIALAISPVPQGTDIIVKNLFCQVDKRGFLHPSIPSIFVVQKQKRALRLFWEAYRSCLATGISALFRGLPRCSAPLTPLRSLPCGKKTVPRTVFLRPSIPSIFVVQKQKRALRLFFAFGASDGNRTRTVSLGS